MQSFKSYLNEAVSKNRFSGTVYHGSGSRFNKFDQRKARVANDYFGGGVAYFTDKIPVAITYAKSMAKNTGGDPLIYEVQLKLNNYFDVDDKFTGEELKKVLPKDVEGFARGAGMLKLGSDKYKVISDLKSGVVTLTGHQVFKGLSKGMTSSDAAREHLRKIGYDGLRYNGGEHMSAPRHNVYLAYNANSVKIKKRMKVVKK